MESEQIDKRSRLMADIHRARMDKRLLKVDASSWQKLLEVDRQNLTATVERGVLLGELDRALAAEGLQMACYTPDLAAYRIGEFYARQLTSVTAAKYQYPKQQVMGLEVALMNGQWITVGGKTVKNVSGYDMVRFYLSNRELLALPMVFTVKLYARDVFGAGYVCTLSGGEQAQQWTAAMRRQRLIPHGQVCWRTDGSNTGKLTLLVRLQGSERQVIEESTRLAMVADELGIVMNQLDRAEEQRFWQQLAELRRSTVWSEAFALPISGVGEFMQAVERQGPGFWYCPLQGVMNIVGAEADESVYRILAETARQWGGSSNWYEDNRYGLADRGQMTLWQRLKKKFDPDGLLGSMDKEGALWSSR